MKKLGYISMVLILCWCFSIDLFSQTTISLITTADTYMNSGSTKGAYNFGGSTTIQLNPYYQGGSTDQYRAPLLKWDLSSIPSNATVTSASLTFYVTTGETSYSYSLFSMRRDWTEGTKDGASGTGASWNYYGAGTGSWGTVGAANTSSDRYNTNLWDAIASDFGATGNKTFNLNADGVTVVQGWITTPASNLGLTIQNYSGTTTGSWIAASRENSSGYTKPTLNITYTSTTPTITTTGTLSAFSSAVGIPSAEQSYSVAGTNLSDNLVITTPTDFQISITSGSGFTSMIPLTPSSGTVSSTTIYIRLNPSTSTTYSANITNTSTGATTKNVAVTGSSVPIINTSGTFNQFNSPTGTPSVEQNYTVSGINLTDNIVITPPPDFEISLTSGSGFSTSPISLTPTSGIVASTNVYVHFLRSSVGTSNGNIQHTSNGATQKDFAVNGTAGNPTITTLGSLAAFIQAVGTPSVEKNYTIAGTFLKDNIIVTAPEGFEISKTTGSGFGSSLTFTPANTTLATSTVYVRMNRTSAGTSSGDIVHTSTDAMTQNVPVTGTAVAGLVCVTSRVSASTDDAEERMDAAAPGYVDINGDASGSYLQTYRTYGSPAGTSLNYWGLRFLNVNVPQGATIISAAVTFRALASSTETSGMTLWEQLSINPTTFVASTSSTYNISSNAIRPRTSTTTEWTIPAWSSGSNYSTPDLSVFIQEIVNQSGWVANNAMVIVGQSTVNINKTADSWDSGTNGPSLAPILEICYTIPTGPTITTTGSLSSFNSQPGVPSAEQSYTVSGSNLTDNIIITPPTDFELSLSSGSGFSTGPISLIQSGGTVAATTIYVRMSRATAGTPGGNITHTSSGATQKNIDVSGTVLPVYTLTVNNDGHGTVTLNPTGGSYTSGTVVTLTATGNSGYIFNEWSGDLTGSTNPVTITMDVNKSITATFIEGETVSLEASEDTYLSSANPTYNYGSVNLFKVTNNSSGTNRGALLKWDLSSIPASALVTNITMTVYVSTLSTQIYKLHNLRRTWVEGTLTTGAASTTSANWQTYDGSNAWGTIGAASTTSDRYDVNLWGAGTTSFSSTGSKTVSLNSDGIAIVQGWIAGTTTNYGLTMQNYSTTSGSDDLQISSSENTTNAGPTLNITYSIITSPTITTSGSITPFSTPVGITSDVQSYTVAGTYLTDDIVITTPADFQISTNSSSGFASTIALTPTLGSISNTQIYVVFSRSTPGTSSGNITHISSGATTKNVSVSGTATNQAPNTPSLVQPADNAVGISTSPTLEVTVSDSNPSDKLDVSYYGRPVSTTAASDFTIIVIPDSQNMAEGYPSILNAMSDWIVSHKSSDNIVFAAHMGDVVDNKDDPTKAPTEWANADAAFDILDAGNIPYSISPGNNDIPSDEFESYFGVSRFTGKPWYGGHYGSDNYNNYSLFSASGYDFILINLQYNSAAAQYDWADGLLKAYPTRRGIVVKHDLLSYDNSWNNQAPFTALKDNPNLFLMLCGHLSTASDGAAYRSEPGDDGHTIHIMLADYQSYPNGGNGYMRILRFSPTEDKIYATTYSPTLPGSIETNPDKMEMVYDMANGEESSYSLIGTVNNVTNGANASISWPGRSNNIEYEWYTTVSDGTNNVTGPTWSFTTETVLPPTAFNVTGTGSYCQSGPGLAVDLTNSQTGVTYTLYKGIIAQTPTIPGTGHAISFGNQTAGTYTVSGTNEGGTTIMNGSAVITESSTPSTPTANITQPNCTEATGTITVTSGTTGLSFSIDGLTYTNISGIFAGLIPGDYYVTARNGDGCTSLPSGKLTINVPPETPAAPTANITQPNCTEATGTITVTSATTGLSFSIDGLTYENISGIFTGLIPGDYYVTARNGDGCTSLPSGKLTINAQPSIPQANETHTPILCHGGTSTVTIAATGGKAPFTGTGNFIQSAGMHSYTVTDANGCSDIVPVNITEPAILEVSESHTTILISGGTSTVTISATGGTSPYTGTGIFNQNAGSHTYTVTDVNGCSDDVVVTINQPVKLTTPNGGENWQVGSSHEITWVSTGISDNVHIEYSTNNGSDWTDIIASTVDDGSYLWIIPNTPSINCIVKTSIMDGSTQDISDAEFTISSVPVTQDISLSNGWNIFSLYVTPGNTDMLQVLKPLIDAGSLIKVQDELGRAVDFNPSTLSYINNIGNLYSTEGYKIKVNSATSLSITGVQVSLPVNIDLLSGWNIISYPVSNTGDAMQILNTLIELGKLVKVQDETGGSIEHTPGTTTWINNIGNFEPGKGYKIKVSADAVLSVTKSGGSGSKGSLKINTTDPATQHYKPIWSGNGLDQMNIYLSEVTDGEPGLKPGDEVGIFDGLNCVGVGAIKNAGEKFYSFVVSADDPTTEKTDGFVKGHALSFRIWRPTNNTETLIQKFEYYSGSSKVFDPMGSAAFRINTSSLNLSKDYDITSSLGDNYPNPFRFETTIPFKVGADTAVDISIYNIQGLKLTTLMHNTLSSGSYTISWKISDEMSNRIMPGIYYCKMVAGNEVFVKTFIVY